MPRTVLTPVAPATGNGYPTLPLTALSADLPEAASDVANGNAFVHTGRELIVARNSTVGAATVTVGAAPDRFGRTGLDIAAYSIAAGKTATFGPFPLEGWRQTTGWMHVNGSDAGILLSILRLNSLP